MAVPFAVTEMCATASDSATKLLNATTAAIGGIGISAVGAAGALTLAVNGAVVNTSVPPCSRPSPLNGVVPSLARTLLASRLTVIVAPDGNAGCGAENKLGPLPRKLPKEAGPNMLKMKPSAEPVDE